MSLKVAIIYTILSFMVWVMYLMLDKRLKRLETLQIFEREVEKCPFMNSYSVRKWKPCLEPCYLYNRGVCYRQSLCIGGMKAKRELDKERTKGVYSIEED